MGTRGRKNGRAENYGSHVAASLWRVADAGRRVDGDQLVVSNADDAGAKTYINSHTHNAS